MLFGQPGYAVADRITKAMPPAIMGKDIPLSGVFDPAHKRYSEATEVRAVSPAEVVRGVLRPIGAPRIDVALGVACARERHPTQAPDPRPVARVLDRLQLPRLEFVGGELDDRAQRRLQPRLQVDGRVDGRRASARGEPT